MNKLDENIIMYIFEFTPNYDVFNIIKLNKFYNNLQNIDYLYEKILYRYHPATFNYYDNYCLICNLKPLIFTDFDLTFARCKHG